MYAINDASAAQQAERSIQTLFLHSKQAGVVTDVQLHFLAFMRHEHKWLQCKQPPGVVSLQAVHDTVSPLKQACSQTAS